MMSRQIDSSGAARWLKRAEQLAWALDDTGVRRNVIDGYLVEGRRVGSLRTARVLDLPGRFVPFENLNVASNIPGTTERPWPLEVTAPGRGVMLERAPGDDVEFAFERPAAPALQTGLIGEPPARLPPRVPRLRICREPRRSSMATSGGDSAARQCSRVL